MKSQTGNKNYQKLRNAIDSLKASNEKINPSSVEKKAGVGNGALAYYTDLYDEVLELKNGNKNTFINRQTQIKQEESLQGKTSSKG